MIVAAPWPALAAKARRPPGAQPAGAGESRMLASNVRIRSVSLLALAGLLGCDNGDPTGGIARLAPAAATVAPASACALLDNPSARRHMTGAFERTLLARCGRTAELGRVAARPAVSPIGVAA